MESENQCGRGEEVLGRGRKGKKKRPVGAGVGQSSVKTI